MPLTSLLQLQSKQFRLGLIALALTVSSPLLAAGTEPTPEPEPSAPVAITASPTYVAAWNLIEKKQWAAAIKELRRIENSNSADVFNLLGFSHRNIGNLQHAEKFYERALSIHPNHIGALEYQGELFVMQNKKDKAEANLAKLAKICGQCEAYQDLKKSIQAK